MYLCAYITIFMSYWLHTYICNSNILYMHHDMWLHCQKSLRQGRKVEQLHFTLSQFKFRLIIILNFIQSGCRVWIRYWWWPFCQITDSTIYYKTKWPTKISCFCYTSSIFKGRKVYIITTQIVVRHGVPSVCSLASPVERREPNQCNGQNKPMPGYPH